MPSQRSTACSLASDAIRSGPRRVAGVRSRLRTPRASSGEVPKWLTGPDSKSGVRVTVPWVRIPPSPPTLPSLRGPRPRRVATRPVFPPVLRGSWATGLAILKPRSAPSRTRPAPAGVGCSSPGPSAAVRFRWTVGSSATVRLPVASSPSEAGRFRRRIGGALYLRRDRGTSAPSAEFLVLLILYVGPVLGKQRPSSILPVSCQPRRPRIV